MIANLKNFTKKNILGLIFLILFLNFLTNNLTDSSSGIFNQLNIYNLGSFLISSLLYFFIAKNINETLHLNSVSLSISYFFISFFLFETLLSLMQITIHKDLSFVLITLLWVVFFIYKKKYIDIFFLSIVYAILRIYNNLFLVNLLNNNNFKELNTDVTVQWLPIAESIYQDGYFFAFTNNIIENQSLLPSYIQTLIFKINFNLSIFEFIQPNSYLVVFLTILIFIDLEISKKNKTLTIGIFLLLIINNEWLFYLISNSLMLEGIVGFLFTAFMINYKKFILNHNKYQDLYFLFLGCLVLTKQFISLLSLIIIILSLLVVRKNSKVLLSFIPLLIDYLTKLILSLNTSIVTYADGLNYTDIIKDILFFNNLELNNIILILGQLFIDKPLTLLLLIYFLSNFIYIYKTKKIINLNLIYFYIGISNFLFIFILYITYWKNIEIQSSYRYVVNLFSLYLASTAINLDYLEK